ncbi:immunoglobulin-like domain-containing protein, partial [Listeria rocourtiae]|uniref:immunoglobulin-like domain-containing protein n=1 Tax=Listeria rocourtiae TaxID=647910 RepID=UPI0003E857E5
MVYQVNGVIPAGADNAIPLIDEGIIMYRDTLLKTLEKLEFTPSITAKTATKTIEITVTSKPTITASDKTIYVGDIYNPKLDVSASDLKDGDITSDVKVVENKVDNMKPGVYEVTYQVTNSVGESTSKTIQVQVL